MQEVATTKKLSRVIGLVEGRNKGPTVVAIGGMHGNEPAGVKALEKVVASLKPTVRTFNGRFLALRGNMEAIERGVRYIDEDMNRVWFPAIIDEIRNTPARELPSSERREIKGLLDILDDFLSQELQQSDQPVIFADLHSCSAEGAMFAITAPNDRNIKIFSELHVPLVFGIEKKLRGSALRFYQDCGYTTVAIEGGQHQNKRTKKNNAAVLLALFDKIGCISSANLSGFGGSTTYLKKQNERQPAQVKLAYQHLVEPNDEFKMQPGFKNFQPVEKGEWLAQDRSGKILAPCEGYILMPLYQQQGNDGFFIVQEVE